VHQKTEIVLAAIRAVENRDPNALLALYHPEVTFEWPPGLPYSGRFRDAEIAEMSERYLAVWDPLQPTPAERRMDAQVVASGGADVVVEYAVRARDQRDNRFETRTLARYKVLDDRLAAATMFYWDHVGLLAFLEESRAAIDPEIPSR
jgi:ketosteroid isomerase-like protein